MANTLPTTIEYFDNLLGEQLTDGGGGGGSSDFSTAEVTINVIGGNAFSQRVEFNGLVLISYEFGQNMMITNPKRTGSGIVNCVLYQGYAMATLIPPADSVITDTEAEGNVTVTDNLYVDITGTGSITVTITAN